MLVPAFVYPVSAHAGKTAFAALDQVNETGMATSKPRINVDVEIQLVSLLNTVANQKSTLVSWAGAVLKGQGTGLAKRGFPRFKG
jgi:hypothetical protein